MASTAAQTAAYDSWSNEFSRKEIKEVWEDQKAPLRKARERKVTIAELKEVDFDELRKIGFAKWDEHLTLIPLWALNYIADGQELVSINGESAVKGDGIDTDVRGGCIAYGWRI